MNSTYNLGSKDQSKSTGAARDQIDPAIFPRQRLRYVARMIQLCKIRHFTHAIDIADDFIELPWRTRIFLRDMRKLGDAQYTRQCDDLTNELRILKLRSLE